MPRQGRRGEPFDYQPAQEEYYCSTNRSQSSFAELSKRGILSAWLIVHVLFAAHRNTWVTGGIYNSYSLDPVTLETRPTHEVLADHFQQPDADHAEAGPHPASLTGEPASPDVGMDWSGGDDGPSYSPDPARTSPDDAPANLAGMYANPDNCPIIFITEDKRERLCFRALNVLALCYFCCGSLCEPCLTAGEVHFLVPRSLHGLSSHHREQKFVVLALRFISACRLHSPRQLVQQPTVCRARQSWVPL